MVNNPSITSTIASLALDYAPPSIRETLIGDAEFREVHDIPTDSTLTFADVSIQLSTLSDAIRSVLSGNPSGEVIDENQRKWQIRNTSPEGELPDLVMCGDVERGLPPIFTALSPDKKTRLNSFDLAAHNVNLPECASTKWRRILTLRALNDEEIHDFDRDFRFTPMTVLKVIHSEVSGGESAVSSLVPPSRAYFESLVGKYDGSSDIRAYATSRKPFFDRLSEWRPVDGFLLSLLLSSHGSLTNEISVHSLSNEELVKAYGYLVANGDRISQLGAIEVGLRVLPSRPDLEEPLCRLIEQIRDDDVDGPASAFKLLSLLFCFVDGELARNRLLSDTPPFYRRLAALTQSALIDRQLVASQVNIDQFLDMMPGDRRFLHYLQSLSDMRQEPRWDPRFAVPSQIKSEFIGRLMICADRYKHTLGNSPIHELVYSDKPNSLQSCSNLYSSFMPGPLEGGETPCGNLPAGFAEIIRDQLSAEQTGPDSFVALVNIGLTFGLNEEQAELAEHVLRTAKYRLRNIKNRAQLVGTLHGLATVAAVARNAALADAIRTVARRYRADARFALNIQETLNICLAAAASRSNLDAWTEYVGECMSEIAFGDLRRDEGLECYVYLIGLRHAVPDLWRICGQADAALLAFNNNK